jgi:hypothetical protein
MSEEKVIVGLSPSLVVERGQIHAVEQAAWAEDFDHFP